MAMFNRRRKSANPWRKWNEIRILVGGKQLKSYRVFSTPFGSALLAAALCWSAPASAQDSCQPVFDALTKIVTTPNHSYSTSTAAFQGHGQPHESETIYVDGRIFIRVRGQWVQSKMTPAEVLEQEKENRRKGKASCQAVRSDSVNGEAATVYSIHSETQDAKGEGQLWISKSTVRLLRKEQDMDVEGAMGKSYRSSRYEYSNVRPPM
jgi:hypothetical protein